MKYGLKDTVDDFELVNSQGKQRSLSGAVENNKMMLVFFRGFW